MDIHIYNQQDDLFISKPQVVKLVSEVLQLEGVNCDEVAVQFVDTSVICKLHQRFFNDPSTTDCITFPIDQDSDTGYRVLGEVFVCPKTGIDYASQNNLNPYHEVSLYTVHGLLHLMGYDDIEDEDEPIMREAEQRHMQNLHKKDLLLKEEHCIS